MSVDQLQNRIRKLKNPSMVAFSLNEWQIPTNYLESNSLCDANFRYVGDLLAALMDTVAAVRFSFGTYAVQGADGLETLRKIITLAKEQGYYVLLDAPEFYSPADAEQIAHTLFDKWIFDGMTINCCLGSDGLKPFWIACRVAIRTCLRCCVPPTNPHLKFRIYLPAPALSIRRLRIWQPVWVRVIWVNAVTAVWQVSDRQRQRTACVPCATSIPTCLFSLTAMITPAQMPKTVQPLLINWVTAQSPAPETQWLQPGRRRGARGLLPRWKLQSV